MRLDGMELSLDVLARFHRSVFSAAALRDYATELNFTAKIVGVLRDELDLRAREPSEALVRWVLAHDGLHEGRVMASVVDRFRPIVRNALQQVLRDVVRRSVAAMDEQVSSPVLHESPPAVPVMSSMPAVSDDGDDRRIVTTERELAAFAVFRGWFDRSPLSGTTILERGTRSEVPVELTYRDTTVYFAVTFNKPTWWVARLVLEVRQPWIAFNMERARLAELLPPGMELLPPHANGEARVALSAMEDLQRLEAVAIETMHRTLDERRARA